MKNEKYKNTMPVGPLRQSFNEASRQEIKKIFILLTIFLTLPSFALAAPSISSVNGTVSHNDTLTVNGGNFGVKTNTAPQLWDTVENQYSGLSNGQTIPVGGGNPWDQNCATEDTDCTKFNTILGEQRGLSTAGYKSVNTKYGFMGGHTISGTNKIYISWWWKPLSDPTDDPTPDGHSGKFVRLSNSSDTENKTFSWTQMHNYVFREGTYCQNGVANWASWNGIVNAWNFHEVWIDGSNHTYTIRINGDDTQASSQSWSACAQFNFDFVKLVGWDSDSISVPLSLTTWMDDIYVDNTFARVMIGDAMTYSASSHFEMQIPSVWSDDSISFNVNQGSFADNSSAYLYVLDASGTANATGFLVTFGAGAEDTTAPSAPTELSVL